MTATLSRIALDRNSLPQSRLDITEKVRANYFPWKGQFSPQLVEELLRAYSPQSGIILDPFVGSGTSLVEAARLGFPACGVELNPAAIVLAQVYRTINFDAAQRAVMLRQLHNRLTDLIGPPHGPLFVSSTPGSVGRVTLEAALAELWSECAPGMVKCLAAALVVLCDFHRKQLNTETVHRTWLRLCRTIKALPESAQSIRVYHADARALPLETGSVDLVLTSPPYINVHNYHQAFRRSVEALECDVLTFARSEIGSNRQNRSADTAF